MTALREDRNGVTMTSTPRTLRVAIAAVSPACPVSRAVIFQYNPDEVSRTIQPRQAAGGGAAGGQAAGGADANRLVGSPTETVSLTAEIDATDHLAANASVAGRSGSSPSSRSSRCSCTPTARWPPRSSRVRTRRGRSPRAHLAPAQGTVNGPRTDAARRHDRVFSPVRALRLTIAAAVAGPEAMAG